MLEEILSRQRSPSDKIGLGYDNNLKTTSSNERKTKLSKKEDEGRSRKCNEELQDITSLARIEDLNSRKLRHQEGPSLLGMKIFFLVIAMFVETLDTKQFIVKPIVTEEKYTLSWTEELIGWRTVFSMWN